MSTIRASRRQRAPRRRGAALVMAVALLLLVSIVAATLLSVHTTQVSTDTLRLRSLRARATAFGAAQIMAWTLTQDETLQDALARAIAEHDTDFTAPALFQYTGTHNGATFTVDTWPGEKLVRLHATADDDGVFAEQWVTFAAKPSDEECYAERVMSLNPLAFWRLGETTGAVAEDEVGTMNGAYLHGVTLGDESPLLCTSDPAIRLDGGDDYVRIAHTPAFMINEGTVVTWFKTRDQWAWAALLSKDCNGYATGGGFDIMLASERLEARLESANATYLLRSQRLSPNIWYHVACTFGTGGMQLYINAQQVDVDGYTGGWGTSSGGTGNIDPITLGIGQRYSGQGSDTDLNWPAPFSIDDTAIYDRALTADEIAFLYDGRAGALLRVLYICPNSASLNAADNFRIALMESWGMTVTPLTATKSQAAYDQALGDADVVYVTEDTLSDDVGSKLTATTLGIVNEEQALMDDLKLNNSNGSQIWDTSINIVSSAHYITATLPTGSGSFLNWSTPTNVASQICNGAVVLGRRVGSSSSIYLAAVPTGGALIDGSPAAGRRVQLPWGANDFNVTVLNSTGQTIMRRSIEWAAGADN